MDKKKINLLIISVVLIITSIITLSLVYQKHGESYKTKDNNQGLNLNSFYDENSLLFDVVNKSKNDIDYSYIQIDGLKKAKIENNINKNIIENVNSYLDNYSLQNVSMEIFGNFGNILSMSIVTLDNNKKETNKFLNYNLVTGAHLSLSDLFTQDSPIEKIIKGNIIKKLQDVKKITCKYNSDYILTDKNQKCEQLDKEVNIYFEKVQQGDYQFYFTSAELNIQLQDLLITIPYFEYPDNFNLYTKFLTNVSIFKNDKIGTKDILIASYRDNGIYSILEEVEENLYVDSVVLTDIEDISTKVKNGIKEIVDEDVKNYKEKDLYTFINQSNNLEKLEDSYYDKEEKKYIDKNRYNIYNLTINSKVYNMSKVVFEDVLMNNIFESHRKKNKDNFIDVNINDTIKLETAKSEMIILSNGKALEEIEDLFVEGYDYKQVVEKKLLELYSLEEIGKLEELEYNYNLYDKDINKSYSIIVLGNNIKKTYISFDEFERTMMNIY